MKEELYKNPVMEIKRAFDESLHSPFTININIHRRPSNQQPALRLMMEH